MRQGGGPEKAENGEEEDGGYKGGEVADLPALHPPRAHQLEARADGEGGDGEFDGRRREGGARLLSVHHNGVGEYEAAADEVDDEEGVEAETQEADEGVAVCAIRSRVGPNYERSCHGLILIRSWVICGLPSSWRDHSERVAAVGVDEEAWNILVHAPLPTLSPLALRNAAVVVELHLSL